MGPHTVYFTVRLKQGKPNTHQRQDAYLSRAMLVRQLNLNLRASVIKLVSEYSLLDFAHGISG